MPGPAAVLSCAAGPAAAGGVETPKGVLAFAFPLTLLEVATREWAVLLAQNSDNVAVADCMPSFAATAAAVFCRALLLALGLRIPSVAVSRGSGFGASMHRLCFRTSVT